jgi:hypothetical protein
MISFGITIRKLTNIFSLTLFTLLLNSCKVNRALDLSAKEAFVFPEKNISFSLGSKSYFHFDSDPVFKYPGLQDSISFESDEKPEYVMLKKTKIKFPELEFEKVMNSNMIISLAADNKYWGYPSLSDSQKITVFDLQKEYNEKYKTDLSVAQLYEKFKKTSSVEVSYYVEYKIGDEAVARQLSCTYKVSSRKSLRFIDNIMSI